MRLNKVLVLMLFAFFSMLGCKPKHQEGTEVPQPVPNPPHEDFKGFQKPSHFPEPVYDFANNPITYEKFRLGRMLFYDPILSKDSCISCAVCHQQTAAFTHPLHDVSHGVFGRFDNIRGRNSSMLANLAWAKELMWDGGIANFENQPLAPIENHVEMDETLANVLKKLNRHPLYRPRFKAAFGKDSIDSQQMLKAIAQFVVMLVSSNSKYDHYVQGKETLTQEELDGLSIVRQKCSSCHAGELFTDFAYRNIGLDSTIIFPKDLGREQVTKDPRDRRKFKTPSLRNFAVTGSYMHDARVRDLRYVLAMHDTLIQDNPNLDPLLKPNGVLGIKLSQEEFQKIYTFLQTLTDRQFLTDSNFFRKASDFAPYSILPGKQCDYVH
jgi:cytochrome c peroxidase